MYFPNAFKKVFVAAVDTGAIDLRTTGSTQNLTAGEIGLFDAKTYAAISAAGSGNQPFILAQGNYRTADKIGQFHGGYTESIKSKVINPRYVSRFFKVSAKTAKNQILELSNLAIECGKTYDLRLDIKGSPALRALQHNIYKTLPGFSGCCSDGCTAPCNGDAVDQTVVLLKWADGINEDPILSKFVLASVDTEVLTTTGTVSVSPTGNANYEISAIPDTADLLPGDRVRGAGVSGTIVTVDSASQVTLTDVNTADGTAVDIVFSRSVDSATYVPIDSTPELAAAVKSTLRLEVAYVDTKFGDCTFSVTDHYELEPLFMYLSIVDESGDPCAVRNVGNSSPFDGVTEVQAPRQASGSGESVVRDLILFNRYLQEPFSDGSHNALRIREIEADKSLSTVDRDGLYDQICLLHSVPRGYNPTGIYDNDQYLLVINVPTGTTTTALTNLISAILTAGGNTVALESF